MAEKIDGSGSATINNIKFTQQVSHPSSPSSGSEVLYVVSGSSHGGLYLKDSGGRQIGPFITGSPSAGDTSPWLVDIIATISSYSASVGTWGYVSFTDNVVYPFLNSAATTVSTTALYNSSGAQNDSISYPVVLSAGTWTINIHARKTTNTAIYTAYIDGVSVGTADSYAAAATYGKLSITSVSVATTGVHTLMLKAETRNGSSSGWLLEYYGISLLRTA